MYDIADIKKFAQRAWDSGTVLRNVVTGAPNFPLRMRFKKAGGREAVASFEAVRNWISALNTASKAVKGRGVTVEFEEVNHRSLGRQRLPVEILFETPEDVAAHLGTTRELKAFQAAHEATGAALPMLAAWMAGNAMKALPHLDAWPLVVAVCEHLLANPRPGIYVRQLTIPGVHTKFVEQKEGLLWDALSAVLPETAYDAEVTGLARNGFERRFGFLYDEPLVRYRLLGASLPEGWPSADVTIPVSIFRQACPSGVDTVFITENKVNGLSFPPVECAMVVFGLGYGVADIAATPWFADVKVFYWGDIDTHGYNILSLIRGKIPQVRSILMASDDLDTFRQLAVEEPASKRRQNELFNLHPDEMEAYRRLLPRGDCEGVRIEQEIIPFDALLNVISGLNF